MPKVRTVRSISDFVDGTTKVVCSPSLPMAAGYSIAALVHVDGPSAGTQHIFGNAGTNKGWALERLIDSGLNAQFQFRAAQAAGFHTAILAVPLAAISGKVVLIEAAIVAQNISIGIGTDDSVVTALGAAFVPGADVTSIGIDVNGGNISPVVRGTRVAAVGYVTNRNFSDIRASTPLAGDLAPAVHVENWTIYSFTQGLAAAPVGPTNVAVPTGTVVRSIGGVAGTATFTATENAPTVQLSPYPG